MTHLISDVLIGIVQDNTSFTTRQKMNRYNRSIDMNGHLMTHLAVCQYITVTIHVQVHTIRRDQLFFL
jgi:hypothetical protein